MRLNEFGFLSDILFVEYFERNTDEFKLNRYKKSPVTIRASDLSVKILVYDLILLFSLILDFLPTSSLR